MFSKFSERLDIYLKTRIIIVIHKFIQYYQNINFSQFGTILFRFQHLFQSPEIK